MCVLTCVHVLHVCRCVCPCVGMEATTSLCAFPQSVFSFFSFFRQGFLLNLEFIILAELAGLQAPGIFLSLALSPGLQRYTTASSVFYVEELEMQTQALKILH